MYDDDDIEDDDDDDDASWSLKQNVIFPCHQAAPRASPDDNEIYCCSKEADSWETF